MADTDEVKPKPQEDGPPIHCEVPPEQESDKEESDE